MNISLRNPHPETPADSESTAKTDDGSSEYYDEYEDEDEDGGRVTARRGRGGEDDDGYTVDSGGGKGPGRRRPAPQGTAHETVQVTTYLFATCLLARGDSNHLCTSCIDL